jgi:hypothetical protein
MTLWQFTAAYAGWTKANKGNEADGPTAEMSDERLAELGIVGFESNGRD